MIAWYYKLKSVEVRDCVRHMKTVPEERKVRQPCYIHKCGNTPTTNTSRYSNSRSSKGYPLILMATFSARSNCENLSFYIHRLEITRPSGHDLKDDQSEDDDDSICDPNYEALSDESSSSDYEPTFSKHVVGDSDHVVADSDLTETPLRK
ncbi:hypothetical protein FQA39_LY11445 [Lamprigera yunnana]|nr:hypothetical protein FQA39_LY11445 [Lamprigera yunnana]